MGFQTKILLVAVIFLALALPCCYKNISQVERRWGPPARVEVVNGELIYYYYFYINRGSGYISKYGFWNYATESGVVTYEIRTDRDGKILGKRKYWKQPG